nr:reverse transcriptase domain-containing protein [Tanacetum cinerariifolium]
MTRTQQDGRGSITGRSRRPLTDQLTSTEESRYQSSWSRRTEPTPRKRYHEGTSSRRTKPLSESKDSGGGHWKSRSKKQKSSIEKDDLSQPWVCEETDPFTPRIRYFNFLKKTRMQSNVKTYDGSDDPKDHLKNFQAAAKGRSGSLRKKTPPAWKQQEAGRKQNFDRMGDFRNQHRSEQRRDKFTLLIKSIKEVLDLDKGKFKTSPPMTTPVEKRNNYKFCESYTCNQGAKTGQRKRSAESGKEGRSFQEGQSYGNPNGPTMGKASQIKDHTKLLPRFENLVLTPRGRGQSRRTNDHRSRDWRILHTSDIWVSRHIKENRLNVREGYSPVRQKKISQAPERNKAIQEEVEKLVDAGIMKEVHYQSWLSNPVLVKKHDDSWRIKVATILQNFKKVHKEERISIDYGSGSCIQANEKANSRSAYANRTYGKGGTYCVPCGCMRSRERSVNDRKGGEANATVSAVLMIEREAKQMPVYFFSRTLQGPEINYTPVENFVLALVHASKRLKRYLQIHPIIVITDQPIKQVLPKPKITGRLQKWSIKLGEYDIQYIPRTSVKGQILADFIVVRPEDDSLVTTTKVKEDLPDPTEAAIPAKIGMSTVRTAKVDMVQNDEALEIYLELLEERREQEAIRKARSKAKIEKYYNSKVRNTSFKPGDLVYQNNDANHAKDSRKLSPKWEGPYEVTKALGKGAYKLRDHNGKLLLRT